MSKTYPFSHDFRVSDAFSCLLNSSSWGSNSYRQILINVVECCAFFTRSHLLIYRTHSKVFLPFTINKKSGISSDRSSDRSPSKGIKVNPGGTSSECPVCGGDVKHPTWKISRCNYCDWDYDRDRLASLAITLRGHDLSGDPFPVSAGSTLPSVMDE